MSMIDVNGAALYYRFDGDQEAPVIVLSNSLASNLTMWDLQVPALVDAGFRVLRYDSRGHGQSQVPAGPYTMEQLTMDVMALLDAFRLDRVAFMGCSQGGMIGQMLATQHGQRLNSLVLTATAAHMPPAQVWNDRMAAVRQGGMAAVAEATIDRWFTNAGQERLAGQVARVRDGILHTPVAGYCACSAAIRDMDQRESIRAITTPTLVMVGQHDPGTPVSAAEWIHQRIVGSELVVLSDCAHFSNIEQVDVFNERCLSFLASSIGAL
ncbi:MAG: 3-oxoadipate enol-lactonase [Gammaproteobacteria bacterium]|nr:3-oxoadipate enol-lactonase [Gammaproteobacteria bacterium]